MPTSEIRADWAAQRIKDLDLVRAVTSALFGRWSSKRGEVIKTLIDQFQYPRLGPGQMWEVARDRIRDAGRGRPARSPRGPGRARRIVGDRVPDPRRRGPADPLPGPALPLDPAGPRADPRHEPAGASRGDRGRRVAQVPRLHHRRPDRRPRRDFPDNWIYIHEPGVRVGRVQNFKNWSPDLVPDPSKTSLGLEYFCFEGDDIWTMPDAELVALGTPGDRYDRPRFGLRSHRRLRGPDAQGLPGLRRALSVPPGGHPRLARVAREPRAGRPQRHAQVQQPGSLDDDRPPGRPEHPRPRLLRHLEGQYRRRVSRRIGRGPARRPRSSRTATG